MNVYRAPPSPLPSLRPVARYDAYDHIPDDAITESILDAHDADHREKMPRRRAARVPPPILPPDANLTAIGSLPFRLPIPLPGTPAEE